MRHIAWLAILAACTPTTPSGSVADEAKAPLGDASVSARAVGLPGAQGASRGFVSIEPVDTCPEALTGWTGPETVVVTPPQGTWDAFEDAQVVRLAAAGCDVIATLDDPDEALSTGFAFDDDGTITWAGLMLRTVQTDSALWVVSNTTTTAWRVDLDTAEVQRVDALDRPVSGITSDGNGGAWAVLMATSNMQTNETIAPFAVVQLDADLQTIGTPIILDSLSMGTGFASIDDDNNLIDRFLATDITVDGQGAVWVTHSLDGVLLRIADGAVTDSVDLGVPYPTGLAWLDERPVIASGALWDGEMLLEPPSLWSVDDLAQAPTPWTALDAPDAGFDVYSGFETLTEAGRTSMAGWFDLESTEDGTVLVADPRGARVMTVQDNE